MAVSCRNMICFDLLKSRVFLLVGWELFTRGWGNDGHDEGPFQFRRIEVDKGAFIPEDACARDLVFAGVQPAGKMLLGDQLYEVCDSPVLLFDREFEPEMQGNVRARSARRAQHDVRCIDLITVRLSEGGLMRLPVGDGTG